jgi:hypothetical protein
MILSEKIEIKQLTEVEFNPLWEKELRKKMLIFRVGDIKPDSEIKECLAI